MSSLRPLITIMLLAAVGVVLYMKINETEPIIPAGVPEWSAEPLQIGEASGAASESTSVAAAPATAAGDAPKWTPESPALSDSPKDANAISTQENVDTESSSVARTAEPDATLPPMPPLPGGGNAATTVGGVAPATSDAAPFVPVDTTPLAGAAAEAPTGAAAAPSANSANPTGAEVAATEPITPTSEAGAATTGGEAEAAKAAAVVGAAAAAGLAATADGGAPPTEAPSTGSTASAPQPADAAAPAAEPAPSKASMYSTARVAVQSALDRGELAQALLLLSDWYDDPSLTAAENEEVNTLLAQLAGSVIYDGPPSHRLEKAYVVQAGETLADVARKYETPAELLRKINGIAPGAALQPGQELKVVRGPFTAVIELGKRKMTLKLDRRYAGKFSIDIDPSAAIEDGQWKVEQKELTPVAGGFQGQPTGATEDRALLLANEQDAGKTVVIRGPGNGDPASLQPAGRVIRLKSNDIADLFDILSEGSRVTILR